MTAPRASDAAPEVTPAEPTWPAIARATQQRQPRRPFVVDGRVVGSVATTHLDALCAFEPALLVRHDGVTLTVPAAERESALADINARLRTDGLVRGWRDERYPLVDPHSLRVLTHLERAASRFWGTLTFGAHATGWLAGASGQAERLWIAQRAFDKATDPGAFDNLVGGGVPAGQSPFETLVREGWEEAGLPPDVMRRARPGRVIRLRRDIPEGLQFEWLYTYDLQLSGLERPVNQDGEVHAFTLHPAAAALAMAAGEGMTVDAALVTLDFALRHQLLGADEQADLSRRAAALWVESPA
jgi:8-oxo-dGTP pyrophosphatase MutT (NUDIX family)